MSLIKKTKHCFYRLGLLAIFMLILAVPIVLWQLYCPHQIASVNHFVQAKSWIFIGLRWGFIGVFVWQWPRFVYHFARKQQWELEKLKFWLSKRLTIALWLIIIEIVMCENILLLLVKTFRN